MPITSSVTPAIELTRMTSISHFDDAASPANASYDVGFQPRYIRVENTTDRIAFEWFDSMTPGHTLQTVAAGTKTLITSGGITVGADGTVSFPVLQNKQFRVVVMG